MAALVSTIPMRKRPRDLWESRGIRCSRCFRACLLSPCFVWAVPHLTPRKALRVPEPLPARGEPLDRRQRLGCGAAVPSPWSQHVQDCIRHSSSERAAFSSRAMLGRALRAAPRARAAATFVVLKKELHATGVVTERVLARDGANRRRLQSAWSRW